MLIHVSREGAPLGQFRRDQISSMLETGSLRAEDLYFEPSRRTWLPLSELKLPEPFVPTEGAGEAPPESPGREPRAEPHSEHRSRRRRDRRPGSAEHRRPRKRHPAESALPGWIVALFAIGAAAGLWAWAQSLRDELRTSVEKVKELEETVATLKRQNSILLEMAPPNAIRGVITTESSPGRLSVLSGVSVSAYRLDDVRSAIYRLANLPVPVNEEEFASLVTAVQRALPTTPLASTLSDASGRFEIKLPEPGQYALVSTAFRQLPGSNERLFWLVEFESRDEPSPVISLSDRNAITLRAPSLKISPARR